MNFTPNSTLSHGLFSANTEEGQAAVRSKEIAKLNQKALVSTQQSLLALGESELISQNISQALKEQGEVLDVIQQNLDHVHADLDVAKAALHQLASPLGFLGASGAQYASNFEKNFGVTGDWSGPMLKQRDLVPSFRERFFVLVRDQLYYFKSVKHMKMPRGICNLRDASIILRESPATSNEVTTISKRAGSVFSVKSSSALGTTEAKADETTLDPQQFEIRLKIVYPSAKTIVLRCYTKREYLGWAAILQRVVDSKAFSADSQLKSVSCADTSGTVMQKVNSSVSNTSALVANPFANEKDVESAIDENLEMMSQMLTRIGNAADHQSFALQEQNDKLDRIEVTVRDANDRTAKLNTKGRRVLGKPVT